MTIQQPSTQAINTPRQPERQATSFRKDEVAVAVQLFQKGTTGADISVMLRSSAGQGLYRKFLAMRDRLRELGEL